MITPWNVTYVGSCGYQLRRVGRWKSDVLDLDTFTEEWYGRGDQIDDFENTLQVGSVHPQYPMMWLADWDDGDGEPGWKTVTKLYKGFRSGKVRAPIYNPSMSLQNISSSVNLSIGKSTVTAEFYASQGMYEFFMTTPPGQLPPPNVPANPAAVPPLAAVNYSGVVNPVQPLTNLAFFYITGPNGITASVSLADVTAAMNTLIPVIQLQAWEPKVVIPGALWHCRTVSVYTLKAA